MTLEVIGTGYPRTGTASLKLALEELGFGPCHHMREIMMYPASAALWVEAAAEPDKADWNKVLAGYRATTDAPSCSFWRELVDFFPNARVIHSVRDPEEWFESTQTTVFGPQWVERTMSLPIREFFEQAVYGEFGDRLHDRDFMLAQFARRTDEIMATVAEERLLVFEAREGWEPLCKFLGVPVPDTPYPKVNTREEMAALSATANPGVSDRPPTLEEIAKIARERFGR